MRRSELGRTVRGLCVAHPGPVNTPDDGKDPGRSQLAQASFALPTPGVYESLLNHLLENGRLS